LLRFCQLFPVFGLSWEPDLLSSSVSELSRLLLWTTCGSETSVCPDNLTLAATPTKKRASKVEVVFMRRISLMDGAEREQKARQQKMVNFSVFVMPEYYAKQQIPSVI
jgi:hypothetical protein